MKTSKARACLAVAISLSCGSAYAGSDADAHPPSITVSVADNSDASALNAEHIFKAIRDRKFDAQLLMALGEPTYGGSIFAFNPAIAEADQDKRRVLGLMGHYLQLVYEPGTDVQAIVKRLGEDPRFAYVEVSAQSGFSATVPNDPFFPDPLPSSPDNADFQYASQSASLALTDAWDRNKGWAHVGLLDTGVPTGAGYSGRTYVVDHEDLQGVVSYNHSWNFMSFVTPVPPPRKLIIPASPTTIAHGTHTLGLIAANADNSKGVAGACWHCSVLYGQVANGFYDVEKGLAWQSYWGAQVINFSGFTQTPPASCGSYDASSAPFCQAMALAELHDIPFVVAAGNDLQGVNFPARDPKAIAVGGIDVRNRYWTEIYTGLITEWPPSSGDYFSGPYRGCPALSPAGKECGSNFSPSSTQQLDFVAPARQVLSTLPRGVNYNPSLPDICNDSNFGLGNDGYGLCSGTSMSAPLVTGVLALMRSVNPLVKKSDLYTTLRLTASGGSIYDLKEGWGRPSAALAVDRMLGKVNGNVVRNRLTPVFAFRNTIDKDRLYTTRPQVAVGALDGLYLTEPLLDAYNYCDPTVSCVFGGNPENLARPYVSASVANHGVVNGYGKFPPYNGGTVERPRQPRASFWIFTSDVNPYSRQQTSTTQAFKPLIRMSFYAACDWRDHMYTTSLAEANSISLPDWCPGQSGNQLFNYDGIEGYVLAECPLGYVCDGSDSTAPQKLYRRYSYVDESWALLIQNQLGAVEFSTYTNDPWTNGDGFLGYVYPNVDSDGDTLPDGLERLYGMNPSSPDSDCDGIPDGTEFPLAGVQVVGHDPRLGGTCP